MTQEQKLDAWAERELKRNIDSIILDDGTGSLVVFGKYRIQPQGTRFQVSTWDKAIHSFQHKKNSHELVYNRSSTSSTIYPIRFWYWTVKNKH
jgi:hypothetical protein